MKAEIGKWKQGIKRVWRFVVDDIWDIELTSLSSVRRFGVKAIRVVCLVFKGFRDDQGPLHASALTFSTLMSIVPVLAVSLALARGLGAGDAAVDLAKSSLKQWTGNFQTSISTNVTVEALDGGGSNVVQDVGMEAQALTQDQIDSMVSQVFDWVDKIDLGRLGGVGLTILLLTVVLVLGRIEFSFNKVWGVTTGRPLHRKIFDYLGILIILPILGVAASSLHIVSLATKFMDESTVKIIVDAMNSSMLKNLMMIVMTTLMFTFLIMFVPNTRVRVKPGLAGGFVAGLMFVLWLWLCAVAQVGAVKYLRIYASFAVLPIVLFWVFISWEIILFGAEVAFAVQNCTTYRIESRARAASVRAKLMLALSVVGEIAKAMLDDSRTFEVAEYAREKRVPVRLLNEVIDTLVHAGLLGELSDRQGAFVLLKSPDRVRVHDVVDIMLQSGADPSELGLHLLGPEIDEVLSKADKGMADGLAALDVRCLAERG